MSKKYNSKKKLSQGAILGNALRTDFQEFNKPVLKYANVPSDWLEKEETKTREIRNCDLLENAFFGDKRRIKIALTYPNGADINCVDSNKNNALILAVYSRKEEAVKYLATYNKNERGEILPEIDAINMNALNKDGLSALSLAVKLGNLRIAKILLENGANPNLVGAYKETPIFDAVKQNDVPMIELLQSYGANINQRNREGATPTIVACQNKHRQEALVHLVKSGASFMADFAGRNPLMHAANNSNGVMMDILLKSANYNKKFMDEQDKNGVSTLMLCCKRGNREATRVLISRGANLNLQDTNGRMAINYAKFYGNPTCFEITQKAMGIYEKGNELSGEAKDKFLETELGKIGFQNRVANSCCK